MPARLWLTKAQRDALLMMPETEAAFVRGLTVDPAVTQQYVELNLKSEWNNGLHIMVGGAAGLTNESERGLLRLMLGYEFE